MAEEGGAGVVPIVNIPERADADPDEGVFPDRRMAWCAVLLDVRRDRERGSELLLPCMDGQGPEERGGRHPEGGTQRDGNHIDLALLFLLVN